MRPTPRPLAFVVHPYPHPCGAAKKRCLHPNKSPTKLAFSHPICTTTPSSQFTDAPTGTTNPSSAASFRPPCLPCVHSMHQLTHVHALHLRTIDLEHLNAFVKAKTVDTCIGTEPLASARRIQRSTLSMRSTAHHHAPERPRPAPIHIFPSQALSLHKGHQGAVFAPRALQLAVPLAFTLALTTWPSPS